jgi:hypothetical protein
MRTANDEGETPYATLRFSSPPRDVRPRHLRLPAAPNARSRRGERQNVKHCTATAEECKQYMSKPEPRLGRHHDRRGRQHGGRKSLRKPRRQSRLKSGDVLVALNGVALTEANKDKLKAVKSTTKPGSTVTYE